jgi:hypothetical protein
MSGLKGISFQGFKGFCPNPNFTAGFQGLASAPIVIDVPRDLGLPSSVCEGMSTPMSLQIQVDVFNQGLGVVAGGQEPMEMYIVAVNSGYLTISRSGSSQVIQGGMNEASCAEVLATPIPEAEATSVSFAGGDLFSTIKDFARNLAPIGRKIYQGVASAAPYIDAGLRSLGAGYTGGRAKKGLKHMAM